MLLYSVGLLEHLLISGIQDQVNDWDRQGFSFTEKILLQSGLTSSTTSTPLIYISKETFITLLEQFLTNPSALCESVGPCLTHLSLRGVIVTDDSLASESRRCCSGKLDKFNTHVRRGFIWSLEEVVILPNSKYTTQRITKASEVNSILHNTQSIMTVW